MKLLGQTTLRLVLDELGRGRNRSLGSGPWTERLLSIADAELGPTWFDVELTAAEALAVVLPMHAGEPCRGDRMMLVGPRGLSVADTADRFRAIEAEYARTNRSCWERIDRARTDPLSRIVLAGSPIDHEEYRELSHDAGPGRAPLFCLDGRHRLVGWALAGVLAPGAVVPAHVVGPVGAR